MCPIPDLANDLSCGDTVNILRRYTSDGRVLLAGIT